MAKSSTFNCRRFLLYILGALLIILVLLKNMSIPVVSEKHKYTTTPPSSSLTVNSSLPILKIGQIYKPGFEYPNTQLCPNNGENVKLIILITSPPNSHEDKRQNIRNTWGHFASRKDIVLGFVIGQPKNEHISSRNQTKNEIETYDDIIIENNVDSYDNLTLKTLSMLEWTSTYCNQSQYLLKTDDDMWINVPNILKFIDGLEGKNNRAIYGSLRKREQPIRDLESDYSKYFVSFDQYSEKYYPAFTAGPGYLLPQPIWKDLFDEALKNKYLKLEDVFFTGVIADKLNIERLNVKKFLLFFGGRINWRNILNYSAVSLSNSTDLYNIWSEFNIGSGSGKCCSVGHNEKWTFYCVFVFVIGFVTVKS